MYEIYAYDMEFEECDRNKEHINVIIPYAVVHYIISGRGYVNGEMLTAGKAFFAQKNTHIEYYPDKENPWSYVYLRLKGEDAAKAFSDIGLDKIGVLIFDKLEEIKNLVSLYNALDADNNPKAQKLIANTVFMLHNQKDRESKSIREMNVKKIKRYIDDNYYKKITVAEIAKEMFLSPDYIRNLFSEYMNISPKQYIQKKRMERARELLKESKMSITLIAYSVGYEDSLLFSKMFSRYFGVSPKIYRQKVVTASLNGDGSCEYLSPKILSTPLRNDK